MLKRVALVVLYDQDIPAPFTGMGLITAEGVERPAWRSWVEG